VTPVREIAALDTDTIRREVLTVGEPAILRGLVSAWPAVECGRKGPAEIVAYLRRFDRGSPVDAVLIPPEAGRRIDYQPGLSGFNYVRNRLPLSEVAEQVLRYSQFANAPAVAAQSAPVEDCLPGFLAEHPLPLLDIPVSPRIWLGNAITTPAHFDEWNNIACVVAGHRRFTLFPPEQLANLYVGPLDYAPTGAPMTVAAPQSPDFGRFPRLKDALAAARVAELAPGDALYLPPLWFHQVESLAAFNVLVNYWWHALPGHALGAASGLDILYYAILNIRSLPGATRAAWRCLFEHYVFAPPADGTAHIPAARLGVLGELPPERARELRAMLAARMKNG
jgi:hypothetical protein